MNSTTTVPAGAYHPVVPQTLRCPNLQRSPPRPSLPSPAALFVTLTLNTSRHGDYLGCRWEKEKMNKSPSGSVDADLEEARQKAMLEVDREILELLPKVRTSHGDRGRKQTWDPLQSWGVKACKLPCPDPQHSRPCPL